MPTAIASSDFPVLTRNRAGQNDELVAYTAALCADEKRRVIECFTESLENPHGETTDEMRARNFANKSQACRAAAKSVGATVNVVLKDGKLYCQYNGTFVALTDAQIGERKAARLANKEAKAAAAATAKPDAGKAKATK